jgi:hypothetical protein
MTEDELWMSYLDYARALKVTYGSEAPTQGIIGRSITRTVDVVAKFWNKHKATLIPFLTNLAIAALEAITAQAASIEGINLPGPE